VNLLFVSHSFAPESDPLSNVGGMQRVAMDLHAELERREDVTLTSLVLRTTWAATGWRTPGFLARALRDIPRLVAQRDIDVILFSSMVTATLALRLRMVLPTRVKLVAITHGLDVTTTFAPYQRWVVPASFRRLDAVCPVSRATAEACIARGARKDQIFVVPNGIEEDRIPAGVSQTAARESLPHPIPAPDRQLLVSVGRQVRRKGFAWFIRNVMPRLPETVDYWLAGDGPERQNILAAITETRMENRVRLLGKVDTETLHALYAAGDIYVMPNIVVPGDMEGFGIVMLEAGLAGLPTVASSLEGILDVIDEGKNGLLVKPESPDAFVGAIKRVLEQPETLRAARDRARKHVLATFTWPAVADRMVATLRESVLAS
jgi:phosphatidylinositol alpha-1,6-mannosyltransferase